MILNIWVLLLYW